MKCCLVITQGNSEGKEIPIGKSEFTIGRDATCNLRPASQHVSKRHCTLRVKGEQLFAEDLQSTNGTFINDTQLKGERELHDGDHLKIGPLDFLVKLDTAADKPTHVEKETQQVPAPAQTPVKAPAPARAPVPVKAPAPAPVGAVAKAPAPAAAKAPVPAGAVAKAPAPAAAKAPAKAPAPKAKSPGEDANNEHLDDDAIGSMLLSLAEDDQGDEDSDSFATGSTVMQVLKPEDIERLQNATDKVPYRPQAPKQDNSATSSSAAKAILEKYRRRPKA
jgi:pSer/pThr/pTyr-binding forkhead associated (FHA) protein